MRLFRTLTAGLVTMAVAGGAHAAILGGGLGGGTQNNNPEVFLAVWDNSGTTNTTVLVDLSIDAQTQDWNTDISRSVDLSALGSIATRSYAVLAAGVCSSAICGTAYRGLFFSAPAAFDGNIFVGASGGTELSGNANRIGSLLLQPEHNLPLGNFAVDGTTSSTSPGGVIPGGTSFNATLLDLTTSNLFVGVAVGTTLEFYRSLAAGSTINTTQLGSGRLWSLDGNTLNWQAGIAPIPLPAGVWLLGSALLGLVGVARRRNQTQVA